MRKSNKQRRISQDRAVSASVEAELLSLLFDEPSHRRGERFAPRGSDNGVVSILSGHAFNRLESAIRSHPCLAIEKESVLKQVHGMLILRLSKTSRNRAKLSQTLQTLACLQTLHKSSHLVQLLDRDELRVVCDVHLKFLQQCTTATRLQQGTDLDDKVARSCLETLCCLLAKPFSREAWHILSLLQFRDFLSSVVCLASRVNVFDELQRIEHTTLGVRQEMVQLATKIITKFREKEGNQWCFHYERWNENDYLFLFQMEVELLLGSDLLLPSEPHVLDRLVRIAKQKSDLALYAAKCLALAVRSSKAKAKQNTIIFETLCEILIDEGTDTEAKEQCIPGVHAFMSSFGGCCHDSTNILTRQVLHQDLKPFIVSILRIAQDNAHPDGREISIQTADILNRLFLDARKLKTSLPLTDVVAICGALLDSPHMETSSCMCHTLLDCLSSVIDEYGPLHVNAIEILAGFTNDRTMADDAALAWSTIQYYTALLSKHRASETDLPRIPGVVESIVRVASQHWERQIRLPCLTLLVRLAEPAMNQKRMAQTSGVIPLLIKGVREEDERALTDFDSSSSWRQEMKSCIETLAAAI